MTDGQLVRAAFCALREAVWYADRYDAFARGFRLGTRLAAEGLWQPEEGA